MPEKTLKRRCVFNGRRFRVDVLEVQVGNGRRASREIIRHPGAVAVWTRMPDGRVMLVRQFRKAIERNLLEIVAGTREPGESPAACARREIREETGYHVRRLTPLGVIYSAPGFCSERLNLFVAELAPRRAAAAPDPDEVLERVLLDEQAMAAMIARGEIQDAKTLAAWALLKTRKGKS